MITPKEISKCSGISCDTVKSRRKKGILIGRKCNDKGDWLYYPPPSGNLSIMKKSSTDLSLDGFSEIEPPQIEYEV